MTLTATMPAAESRSSAAASARETSADDRALVVGLQGGDEQSLASLYDRHAPVLLGLVMRFVRDRSDAEGVLMEAFLQAWRTADSFDGSRGSVMGWLTSIARSRALDFARTTARREKREPLGEDWEAPLVLVDTSIDGDPSAGVEADELRETVDAALRTLQPAQRRAIELAFYEGLTHVEVAERLAEPLGSIKTRIRLGMLKLRELLAPLDQGSRA